MTLNLPPSLWPTVHRLAAGEAWPPSSVARATRTVTLARDEGLLFLLFAEPDLPVVVQTALDSVRALDRLNTRRTELLLIALRRVAGILADEPFALLKGAEYGLRLYPRPTLRPRADVDLLVPRERMPVVTARLAAAGLTRRFTSSVAELPSHHEKLFQLGDVQIDVHQSFVQRPRARVDYDAVWARRQIVAGLDFMAYRLADEDALVYHALSMAIDEFRVPLIRYVDLWLMGANRPELWESAAARAREWGVERALYGALRLAIQFLPELHGGPVDRVRRDLLTPITRGFLDRWVLPEPWEQSLGRPLPRAAQLWRKYWLMDGLRARIGFAAYHAWAVVRSRGMTAAGSTGGADLPPRETRRDRPADP